MNTTINHSKTWFITGASSGFGRMLTEKLLARGDRVVATLRRQGALDDLLAQYGAALSVLPLEMTDPVSIRNAVAQAFADAGRIDVVVGNAGYALVGAAEELGEAAIERQISTNLTGAIHLIRAVLPHLRAQGGGRFAQVSSEGGQVAYPAFGAYHATKWGIEGFVEAAAQEVAPFGIEMVLIEPGPTSTDFAKGIDLAPSLATYAETPAGAIRRMIDSNAFPITTDLGRSVDAIIQVLDAEILPRRLALGSAAHDHIREALMMRRTELDQYRDLTLSADAVRG